MKLCMGCMNQIEDYLSTCPYCGFNEMTLRQESYYLDPGTVIGGKYIVGRVLNYGGHTVSYLGMDAEYNRKVIVKEYLPSDFSTRSEGEKDVTIYSGDGQVQFEQGLTNFLNEANRIQHLQDAPGIAKVYDCVAENETGYVISEYVEGRTLKEILESGKKYSAEEAAAFIRKILQGLSGVHHMDIVHCDISPETIMVTNTGDIKLMDFGATRYVTTANSKSLSIILKRGYAPEEQYRSKGVRGPWTDVYAVGAVMYRMITGVVPQESVERALADDLKEPSKMGVSISKDMENALMNALNVYQNDRTPSAEVFLRELNSENVRRIKVKQKKNKTGKFPLWAKGLVAGLACVVVVGGVFVVRKLSKNSPNAPSSNVVIMQDLRNKTSEEASNYIADLNKEHGWDIRLEVEDTVFDLTKEDSTVCSQSINPGVILDDPDKESQTETSTESAGVKEAETSTELADAEEAETSVEEMAAKEDEMPEGLQRDEQGNITGTISVTLYSRNKIHYKEINGLNAYVLAQKLDIDTTDKQRFLEEDGNDNTDYFDLAFLEVAGETISVEDIEANQDKELAYSEDIKIHYYATDFFYWDKLPDFASEYKTIDAIGEQKVYRYADEKKMEVSGEKALKGSNLIDDSYYAIKSDEYDIGTIVAQNIAPGSEYDGSNPSDGLLVIGVVGKAFEYQGKTGEEFVDEITEANEEHTGFGKYEIKDRDGIWYDLQEQDWKNRKVVDVKVYKTIVNESGGMTHSDENLDCFQKDGDKNENVWFVITVEAAHKVVPTPSPTPTPSPAPTPTPTPTPTQPSTDAHDA